MPQSRGCEIWVESTTPSTNSMGYRDVIRVKPEGGKIFQYPGPSYRATKTGEKPTHFPEIENGNKEKGFLLEDQKKLAHLFHPYPRQ